MTKVLQAFVANLYCAGTEVPVGSFPRWALEELRALLPFDAALWGGGSAEQGHFHNATLVGLPSSFVPRLEQTRGLNPIAPVLQANPGLPVDMRDVISDDEFFQSPLYLRTFREYGIERLLSTTQIDGRSGLYNLLTLYRFDRDRPFSEAEKQLQAVANYHMVQAASHVSFLHLTRPHRRPGRSAAAVVDSEGMFREVQPALLDLLETHSSNWQGKKLPFPLPAELPCDFRWENFQVHVEPMADLLLVRLRPVNQLDALSRRERQVVMAISAGKSHKEAAKELGLAPTTVSSHLYKAYEKLSVDSRSALAALVKTETSAD